MSSQDRATSETALLLGASRRAGLLRVQCSPEVLLIPVVLAMNLGTLIPATTFIELIRQAVCRLSNVSHSDAVSGGPPPDICDAPEIQRSFSTVIAIFGVTQGIISTAGCGVLSLISSNYGRKPTFISVLIAGITGNCLIPSSQYAPNWLSDWVLLVGTLCQLVSNSVPRDYLINTYIVDVCFPEDRTSALSKMAGWAALGICISYAIGGSITTKTGNPLIVFYIATAIFVSTFIYVVFNLPETFPKEKRNALSRLRESSTPTARLGTFLHILEPLKMLVPTPTPVGSYNWRLTWCAIHTFIFMTSYSYISSAWMVLATSKYHLSPADTGLFFTIISVSGTIILILIVPLLVHFLRPYYSRKVIRTVSVDEDINNDEVAAPEASDRLDVHLAFASCIIAAISIFHAAASTAYIPLIISGIFIGFTGIHTPTTRSLVAGSVDPLKQGEALAAIEIVNNAGSLLSPIIMGGILSATIDTQPLLLFSVNLVIVPISAALLLLVRDADRYQKSNI